MTRPSSHDDALACRRELYGLATQYRASAIFLASLELNLYSHIPPEGIDAERLAEEVGCEALPLGLLLEALLAIGVLSGDRGNYRITSGFAEFLVRGSGSFADFLLLQQAQSLLRSLDYLLHQNHQIALRIQYWRHHQLK